MGDDWKISERLTRMVEFRCLDLMGGDPQFGRFAVVFLRNMLIRVGPLSSNAQPRFFAVWPKRIFLASSSMVGAVRYFGPSS